MKDELNLGGRTFPMYVWLATPNPWNASSIMVNGFNLTTTKQKIYTPHDLYSLRSVEAYLLTESILTEDHSDVDPTYFVPPAQYTGPVQEVVEAPPTEKGKGKKKIKEELPKEEVATKDKDAYELPNGVEVKAEETND
jgi:hypothetical protein